MTARSTADAACHVDHMAGFLGLDVRPEWRDAVAGHFEAMMRAADDFLSVDLPEDCEPAETFRP